MAIVHDSWDMEHVATAAGSTAASTETVSEKVLDLLETGGLEESTLWVTCSAGSAAVTLTVLGSDTPDGAFDTTVLEFTTTAAAAFEKAVRTPLDCPRYLKLKVATGETAPSTAVTAMLRFAV